MSTGKYNHETCVKYRYSLDAIKGIELYKDGSAIIYDGIKMNVVGNADAQFYDNEVAKIQAYDVAFIKENMKGACHEQYEQ